MVAFGSSDIREFGAQTVCLHVRRATKGGTGPNPGESAVEHPLRAFCKVCTTRVSPPLPICAAA